MPILRIDELDPPVEIRFCMQPDFQMCSRDFIEALKDIKRGYACVLYNRIISNPDQKKALEKYIGDTYIPGMGRCLHPVIKLEGVEILSTLFKFEPRRYEIIMNAVREYIANPQASDLPSIPEEASQSRKRKWSVAEVPSKHPAFTLSIRTVMHELGFPAATQEEAVMIGVAVAEPYFERNNRYPPHHESIIRGQPVKVYSYLERDRDLVEAEVMRRAGGEPGPARD